MLIKCLPSQKNAKWIWGEIRNGWLNLLAVIVLVFCRVWVISLILTQEKKVLYVYILAFLALGARGIRELFWSELVWIVSHVIMFKCKEFLMHLNLKRVWHFYLQGFWYPDLLFISSCIEFETANVNAIKCYKWVW